MQAVYNIAEICHRHGITDVVLSPGSRSAPLTLAFARHPAYRGRLRVVPDERAAAFIGLGIAQATRRTVVLVCTSGTAGLNYAPAVAEAYFQQIPLLILTADRPPEWIDQLDGQTIRQRNLYGAHAKGAFDFPADTSHPDAKWHSERTINEAINLTMAGPAGPVQVNVPLREPFYPKAGEEMGYEDVKVIREVLGSSLPSLAELRELAEEFSRAEKVLFVFGQQTAASTALFLNKSEEGLLQEPYLPTGVAVVGDIISNLEPWSLSADQWEICTSHDIFLAGLGDEEKRKLQPDLVISCGLSLISKSLKLFLRAYPAKQHWHLQPAGEVADTLRGLTRVIRVEPSLFLSALVESSPLLAQNLQQTEQARIAYDKLWNNYDQKAQHFAYSSPNYPGRYKDQPFNEFSTFHSVVGELPLNTALHFANSMAVRYANILGLPLAKEIEVFANRGTSGIDGCTSTAVGAALAQPERPVVLLTGDVAFFYDRNAFWHNYSTPNLRVVLFNNHGGGIFRLIDGPRQQPELDEFFETKQTLAAENTARDFNLRYFPVSSFAELDAALPVFFAAETGAAILEIFTDSKTNAAFFEEYRKAVKAAFA
jgi:2-succinyl-5-enolpyruvyl-6-hydroxy-3-cyclohexene-1-carboxylate synthase